MPSRKGWHFFIMKDCKICSFFGHRKMEITDQLYESAYSEIVKSIQLGCRTFYFGGYSDFDDLCYSIVTSIKQKETQLNIERVYCVAQERYLYKKAGCFNREDYDKVVYLIPSFNGWYKSIYFRNCAMIDDSDVVIFCVENRENSGAYKAFKYAKKKKDKVIVNIW